MRSIVISLKNLSRSFGRNQIRGGYYRPAENHGIGNTQRYDARNGGGQFSLNHDDGVSDKNLQEADVIFDGRVPFGQNADLSPIWPYSTVIRRRKLSIDSR